MPVDLTPEQKAAIVTAADRFVVASPGSGKTRIALAKILEQAAFGAERGSSVLAMTFAVNAKEELERRIESYAGASLKRQIVAITIHGFALSYLVGPHGELYCGRTLTLAQPGGAAYRRALDETAEAYGLEREQVRSQMDYVRRVANGDAVKVRPLSGRARDIAIHFWDRLLEKGYVDYPNSLYIAATLLQEHEWLRNGIAAEFSTIVVDEYQDCTDIQLSILRQLRVAGSHLFLVGDLFQCVFGFAGADTGELDKFVNEIGAEKLELSGTHRCPPAVLEIAERMFERQMQSVGKAATHRGSVTLERAADGLSVLSEFVHRCDQEGIRRSEIAFVCPSNEKITDMVARLSERGIPAAFVNARVDEEDWFASTVDTFLQATFAKEINEVNALVRVVEDLIGRFTSKRYLLASSRDLCRDAAEAVIFGNPPLSKGEVRSLIPEIVARLSRMLDKAKILLREDLSSICAGLEYEAGRFQDDPRAASHVDVRLADVRLEGKVRGYSYQGIKGLEFEAVAVLDIAKGWIPHYRSKGVELWDELRKLYVAVTRSNRKLMLHVPSNEESPFLPILTGRQTAREVIGCPPPAALRTRDE